MGVLHVQSSRMNAYSDEDVDLLAGLANVAAISIQDALLAEEVRHGLEGTIESLGQATEMRPPAPRDISDTCRSRRARPRGK
jgi:GAF domain-containing protein